MTQEPRHKNQEPGTKNQELIYNHEFVLTLGSWFLNQ